LDAIDQATEQGGAITDLKHKTIKNELHYKWIDR
jgi:hypothetical protein